MYRSIDMYAAERFNTKPTTSSISTSKIFDKETEETDIARITESL